MPSSKSKLPDTSDKEKDTVKKSLVESIVSIIEKD